MVMQTYALSEARINKFKGEILKHAVPQETLCRQGRQVRMPKNSSKTYIARRFLPYGATAGTNRNTFFGTTTAVDRGNAMVTAHLASEGVTPTPDSITPEDVTVVMQQYNCLYGWTDHTADTYEDDIPAQMKTQIGERITLVNEMICFGALKASTNKFYGGTGTSRATVNGGISLPMIRKMSKSLQAQHGKMVSNVLKPGANYATEAVAAGYFVYCHTDLEPDIRDLPGFIPAEKYASGSPLPNELGKVERFRFITSPEFVAVLDGGAAVGATGLQSNLTVNVDVYQFIVCAADGWSQVAIRGKESMDVTFLPTGMKSKSDPHGQRGYAGAIWWKAVMIENPGWTAVGEVGVKSLQPARGFGPVNQGTHMENTVMQYLSKIGSGTDREALTAALQELAVALNTQAHVSAGLVIKAGTSALAKNGALYRATVGGRIVSIAANTDMPALTGLNITANYFNVACFFVDSAGAVTASFGTEAASAGAVKFPNFPLGKALVGYLLITHSSAFTGGTTALDTATTVYVSPTGAVNPTILFN